MFAVSKGCSFEAASSSIASARLDLAAGPLCLQIAVSVRAASPERFTVHNLCVASQPDLPAPQTSSALPACVMIDTLLS